MNVREVINYLINFDPDAEVRLASDSEGNDILPVAAFGYESDEGDPDVEIVVLWP